MRFSFFLFLIFIPALLIIASGKAALSQKSADYCDKVESTADAMACINRNKQDIQKRLNEIYAALLEEQGETNKSLLGTAQTLWVAYRDAQCSWETGNVKTPALERVSELSCLTALTKIRTDLLASILNREKEETPREFGTNPRWMNVLAHDYPDVFWRYGHWIRTDMDCDGNEEQVMSGISFSDKGEDNVDGVQNINVVLAISNNPETGKPKANIFRIPVTKKEETVHFCKETVDLMLVPHPLTNHPLKEDSSQKDAAATKETPLDSCSMALQAADQLCTPVQLFWNGTAYELLQTASVSD